MGARRQFKIITPSVPLEIVPESLRQRVSPDSSETVRGLVARALIPAEPSETLVALAYLGAEAGGTLATTARQSIKNLPERLLLPVLREPLHESVLAYCATVLKDNPEAIETIVLNSVTPDDAVAFVASTGSGRVLELIARNQVRLLRSADIVEAIYFNPNTGNSIASSVMETAVRGGLDISNIPGHEEIKTSILGTTEPDSKTQEAQGEPLDDTTFRVLAGLDEDQEVGPALFDELLREESRRKKPALREASSTGAGSDEDSGVQDLLDSELEEASPTGIKLGKEKLALGQVLREMSVAHKTRMALMGNASARAMLIRDPKRTVAMAVLRSPGLTDKEVASFAQNKSLADDVIRYIATKRDWTRNYAVRRSLVANPKCPPAAAQQLLSSLRSADLRSLTRDKEVPAYVSRAAKRLVAQKDGVGR